MARLTAATDLLDEGLRLYRRNAGALLGFAFGPALAMALIITLLIRHFSTTTSASSGWVVLMISVLFCVPLLVFMALGVLHGVGAGKPPQVRRMAEAALHRLGHRIALALAVLLPMQIVGLVAARVMTQLVEHGIEAIKDALRFESNLPWLFVQICVDGLNTVERLVIINLGGLAVLLPCAGVLYLLQHRLLRLPRPSVVSWSALANALQLTTAGALLISWLAFGALYNISFLINMAQGDGRFVVFFGLVLLWFWFFSPPLPIWMALLYRRNREPALGGDLERRVQVWSNQNGRQALQQPLLVEG
ncbi:MAG TPA: hypothetical protein VFS21_27890 [Roseiflexaceae bacterium]|nr:hypothetical protein [Roseiflexaceae bacterium]